MKTLLPTLTTILFLFTNSLSGLCSTVLYGNYYVKSTATGSGDGSSWTDAFTNLQDAIDQANPGDIICVAAGIYLPTQLAGDDTVRSVTFYINKSIVLYGGFSGEPGTEGSFNDRNPALHPTVLSGDTGIAGDESDNAFHIVYFEHVSDSTRLDGFVIADGNSINAGGFDGTGVGIFNNGTAGRSNPVIANCVIRNNAAQESGGGMLNYAAEGGKVNPLLINCAFTQNEGSGGGAISNYTDGGGEANPMLIGCSFKGNTARTADGGAMSSIAHSATASPVLINCIVTGNHAPTNAAFQSFVTGTGVANPQVINSTFSGNTGGAIRVTDLGAQTSILTIRNSIIFGNAGSSGISTNGATVDAAFSVIPFGFAGENIISLDPMFVSQPPLDSANIAGDVHLLDPSPAIDAGRNEDVPPGVITDFDNQPRFINPSTGEAGIVDIGAYEVQDLTTRVDDFLSDTDWHVYPNPAHHQLNISITEPGATGEIRLLDVNGNTVGWKQIQAGQQVQTMNVSRLPSGIYFVHILLAGRQDAKKIQIQ